MQESSPRRQSSIAIRALVIALGFSLVGTIAARPAEARGEGAYQCNEANNGCEPGNHLCLVYCERGCTCGEI